MDSAPLSPTSAQALRGAVAAALATQTRVKADVLGERREVAVLGIQVALHRYNHDETDDTDLPWVDVSMRIVLAELHRYSGTINSIEAIGILALFGVPSTHEDDAVRAARAALAIQHALLLLKSRLQHQRNLTLHFRISLHLGSVIQSQSGFGESDYSVIGDTTSLARALLTQADDSTIVASTALYERTKTHGSYELIPAVTDSPTKAFYTLRQTAQPTSTNQPVVASSAMIGRADELAALMAVFQEMLRKPAGQIVAIRGDAGIGKSRLVAEFGKQIADTPTVYATVSCRALNRAKPLVLVADMLRALLGVGADLPVVAQRAAFVDALGQLQLVAEEIMPYLDLVLSLSQPTPPRNDPLRAYEPLTLQRQIHLIIRRLILAVARTKPTVLILDDLQWIDPASRDFFEYAIQTTRASHDFHLMIVLVTRDHGADGVTDLLISAAGHDPVGVLDLPLVPLTPAESQLMARQLLTSPDSLQAELAQKITQRAAGNPLYIEELIRMLSEQGALATTHQMPATGRRAELVLQQLPETLQGLLVARFSALPERLRRVLQRAAILGRSFPLRLIQELEQGSLELLNRNLGELITLQFLAFNGADAERICSFQHTLLHEAIYQTLLLADRQRLHSQAAQVIEGNSLLLSDDERTVLLAYHHAESTEPIRALPYLVSAAERSAQRYANESAIEHYQHALRLIGAGEHNQSMLNTIQFGLGRALKLNGQYAEATQILNSVAQALRDSSNDRVRFVDVLRELAETHQRDGNLDLAVAALDEGLTLIERLDEPASQVHRRALIDRLAAIRFRQGDLAAAYRLTIEATAELSLDAIGDPTTVASLYNTHGGILWQRGDLAQASQSVAQSLLLYQRINDSWGMATAYTNLGVLNYALGRWSDAVEQFQRSDKLRMEIGYLPERAVNLKNLGMLQMEMGRHEEARQSLETSLTISRSCGDDYGIVIASLQLADLTLLQKRPTEARAHLEEASRLLAAAGEDEQILIRWLTGLADAAEGNEIEAIAIIQEALNLAVAAGVAEFEIDCRRVLGSLESRRQAYDEAERQLQLSHALSIEHANTFREGLSCYELGWHTVRRARQQVPIDPVEFEQAHAYFTRATECFTTLDARYELQRVQSALQLLG